MATDRINQCIEAFQQWDSPWHFHDFVIQKILSNGDAATDFEAIWAEANDKKHWNSDNLSICSQNVEKAILEKFPALSLKAAVVIANAAAYLWI